MKRGRLFAFGFALFVSVLRYNSSFCSRKFHEKFTTDPVGGKDVVNGSFSISL